MATRSPRKSGRQDLDGGRPFELAQGSDRLDESGGAAIGQIVAIDGGDDDVLETHPLRRLGELPRLVGIDGLRPTVGDGTVGAVAGADATVDEEGGGAARETLGAVRAARLFADRVQPAGAHALLDLVQLAELHLARPDPLREDRRRGPSTKTHSDLR